MINPQRGGGNGTRNRGFSGVQRVTSQRPKTPKTTLSGSCLGQSYIFEYL